MDLSLFEARCLIEKLGSFDLAELGTSAWTEHHSQIQRLNIQAHHGAQQRHDEFVVEEFVSQQKIGTIIHDLIVTEVWKSKVLPHISNEISEDQFVKIYMMLYHEAILINLLEILMYHGHAVESVDDMLIELVDYCSRRLVTSVSLQLNQDSPGAGKENLNTVEQRIEETRQKLDVGISASALTVLRFLTDRVNSLSIAVLNRLLNHNDVLMTLVSLVDNFPWSRRSDQGVLEKYEDGVWKEIAPRDSRKISKMEGQLWISLYNLTMDSACRQRYEIHDYRKSCLLRLRTHMNQVLLDQLPILRDMRRFLEELSLRDVPSATDSSLICIQMIPEVWDNLMKQNFEMIARSQLKRVLSAYTDEQRKADMTKLAEVYNMEAIESMLEDPKCGKCGKMATKRCSRCKLEWYCGRECQIRSWPTHKALCDVVTNS